MCFHTTHVYHTHTSNTSHIHDTSHTQNTLTTRIPHTYTLHALHTYTTHTPHKFQKKIYLHFLHVFWRLLSVLYSHINENLMLTYFSLFIPKLGLIEISVCVFILLKFIIKLENTEVSVSGNIGRADGLNSAELPILL